MTIGSGNCCLVSLSSIFQLYCNYIDTCQNRTSLEPAYVFGIDRCSVYTVFHFIQGFRHISLYKTEWVRKSRPTRLVGLLQCSFSLMLHAYWRRNKYQFYSLVWSDGGSNPRSKTLEASTRTITPTMQFWFTYIDD